MHPQIGFVVVREEWVPNKAEFYGSTTNRDAFQKCVCAFNVVWGWGIVSFGVAAIV